MVNKYFHFDPTPKELFDSVSKDKKYDQLNEYKVEILKAIEETEELNARIYIQVLDNCLEWMKKIDNLIKEINKYGYKLYVSMGIDEDVYEKIVFFVKTGILPKQTKEVESSLPPEAIAKIKA